jgi:riboflavin kinase / FMN adenylyltransferase
LTVLPWESLAPRRDPPSAYAYAYAYALTIGVFDGIHLGHQRLIAEIVSGSPGTEPVVCSFRQNPAAVLGSRHVPGSILTLRQKQRKFESLGVRYLVLIDFSIEISTLSGADFFAILQRAFDIRRLVVGYNFHMGRGRATGIRELESLLSSARTRLTVVPAAYYRKRIVSSSRIRDAILQARFREAREMLGEDYRLDLEGAEPVLRGGVASVDRRRIGQVLPPVGSYSAELRGEGSPLRARVSLTADALEWDSSAGWRVSEICFSD